MGNEESSNKPFDLSFLASESKRAFWIAYRVTKSTTLAEDAVQEAYASFIRNPPRYCGDDAVRTRHAFLMAVRLCAGALMRGERRRRRREKIHVTHAPKTTEEADEVARNKNMAAAARSAIGLLPLEEREAVSLCYEQGFTWESAADLLGIPKQTLGRRVKRGLEKLRNILTSQGYASATPPAVGAALSALPLPPLSDSLAAALQKIAADPNAFAPSSAISQSMRTAGVFSSKATITAAGVILCTTAAIGVWRWNATGQLQDNKKLAKIESVEKQKRPQDQEMIAEKTERFYRRWTFAQGVPEDLEFDENQKWTWRKPDKSFKRGGIAPASDQESAFVGIPMRLPKGDVLVTVKTRNEFHAQFRSLTFGYQSPDELGRMAPSAAWNNELWSSASELVFEQYSIANRWSIVLCNGKPTSILRYDGDNFSFTHARVGFMVKNIKLIEEIEMRELKTEEIPEFLRDPEKLMAKQGIRLQPVEEPMRSQELGGP